MPMEKTKKVVHKVKETSDNSARRAILEDLFYDFHKRKGQIYWINFWRGIFFGLGSVLGATILITIAIWILSLLVHIPGGIGSFIQTLINVVNERQPR